MTHIRQKREKLETFLTTIYETLSELQAKCDHSGSLTYMYDGNSGNWDRSDDAYWINWHCAECGKKWMTEQNLNEMRKYPNAVQIKKNR